MRTLWIFQSNQHYLTVVDRNGRKNAKRIRIRNPKQLYNLIELQNPTSDYYITKYAKDDVVWNIILDFDSIDKEEAYKDVMTLRKFLKGKGVNAVIVDSTNKGFHCYIEVPPTNFREFSQSAIEEPSLFFKHYVIKLCNLDSFKFKSLDEVNFNASLDGNIRVIGTIHPKSLKRVCIIDGFFHDSEKNFDYYCNAMHYCTRIYESAYRSYKAELDEIETKRLMYRESLRTDDDLLDKDLRDVFKSLFHLEKVREYNGATWCLCPFHNDNSPSFCITPTHYFCASCGEKGNIFTLIKKGLIESPRNEYWITQGAKNEIINK